MYRFSLAVQSPLSGCLICVQQQGTEPELSTQLSSWVCVCIASLARCSITQPIQPAIRIPTVLTITRLVSVAFPVGMAPRPKILGISRWRLSVSVPERLLAVAYDAGHHTVVSPAAARVSIRPGLRVAGTIQLIINLNYQFPFLYNFRNGCKVSGTNYA